MSSLTPNYNLIKPGVNDPTDQDQWGGMLNEDMDIIDSTMKSISDKTMLPVGSLYFNADVATNPATLLGYGTWVAFSQGRVILGVGSGTDANGVVRSFANGDTGGEYEHTQTGAEVGSHAHDQDVAQTNVGGTNIIGIARGLGGGTRTAGVYPNQLQADVDPMPWMQPYITVYIWKRSA